MSKRKRPNAPARPKAPVTPQREQPEPVVADLTTRILERQRLIAMKYIERQVITEGLAALAEGDLDRAIAVVVDHGPSYARLGGGQ